MCEREEFWGEKVGVCERMCGGETVCGGETMCVRERERFLSPVPVRRAL